MQTNGSRPRARPEDSRGAARRRPHLIVRFDAPALRRTARVLMRRLGFSDASDPRCRWHGQGLVTLRLDGPLGEKKLSKLRVLPGVLDVIALTAGEDLAARRKDRPDSVVTLPNGAAIGGPEPAVIAGPCSVESASQVCEVAAMVRDAGAAALRAGAYKPRTSPYSFGGIGRRGLDHLARAREKTGLPVVTEVLDPLDLDLVARYADVIQIGSRNMQNFPLLFQAGGHPLGKPILLKRSFGATIEEFLLAAEYVLLGRLSAGRKDPGLILCERGIRTFETSARFSLDMTAIPILREKTHLPVLVDPSHAAGQRRHVLALARSAVAAGAHGLLVEVHPTPQSAWSDGAHAIDLREFRRLMEDVRKISSLGLNRAP
jgi:3-deoxy-7-phosphoheptulonate synthase